MAREKYEKRDYALEALSSTSPYDGR